MGIVQIKLIVIFLLRAYKKFVTASIGPEPYDFDRIENQSSLLSNRETSDVRLAYLNSAVRVASKILRSLSTNSKAVADKHIVVTEKTRKELEALKEPGETYDDLLKLLARDRRRQELAMRFRDMDRRREEFVALDES